MKKITSLIILSSLLTVIGCDNKPKTEKVEPAVAEQAKTSAEPVHEPAHEHTDASADHSTGEKNSSVISVTNVMFKTSFPGQSVASAFFTLANDTDETIEVTAISSDVAKTTEFHTMSMKDSKMVMRQMDKVEIPAKGKLVLNQGAKHVMFIGLNKPLEEGDKVNLVLTLSNGETLNISGAAKMADDMNADHEAMDHSSMDHGKHGSDDKNQGKHETHNSDAE